MLWGPGKTDRASLLWLFLWHSPGWLSGALRSSRYPPWDQRQLWGVNRELSFLIINRHLILFETGGPQWVFSSQCWKPQAGQNVISFWKCPQSLPNRSLSSGSVVQIGEVEIHVPSLCPLHSFHYPSGWKGNTWAILNIFSSFYAGAASLMVSHQLCKESPLSVYPCSACVPWARSTSIIWELIRNADSQAPLGYNGWKSAFLIRPMCTLRLERHRCRRNCDLACLGLALDKLMELKRDLGNLPPPPFFSLEKACFYRSLSCYKILFWNSEAEY